MLPHLRGCYCVPPDFYIFRETRLFLSDLPRKLFPELRFELPIFESVSGLQVFPAPDVSSSSGDRSWSCRGDRPGNNQNENTFKKNVLFDLVFYCFPKTIKIWRSNLCLPHLPTIVKLLDLCWNWPNTSVIWWYLFQLNMSVFMYIVINFSW